MAGLPVTIRLLDPPLHEFLPHTEAEIDELAAASGLDAAKLKRRAGELSETNPMLGWRGCRLGIAFPEIYEMQVRAIFEAACAVAAKGEPPIVEVMHPLVAKKEEMAFLRNLTDAAAKAVLAENGVTLDYKVGAMIELPRAALRADQLAEHAEFFSFGTNDLTQTTFGISRDDSGKFLDAYLKKNIIESPSTRRAWASWCGSAPPAPARPAPTSSSASAASTAATPPPSPSARTWGWITCRARPTACRSRGWRRPRPRWRRRAERRGASGGGEL
jgi:pyruvate,orthophosphate dikinase